MDVELYWIPGCTSCLRMKEFVESTGIPFVSINVTEQHEQATRLAELGTSAPAAVIGDQWACGGDLRAVAELLGIDYEDRAVLSVPELHCRYQTVMSTLMGLLHDTPATALDLRWEDWEWTLRDMAHHGGSVMRVFLIDYDQEQYHGPSYQMDYENNRAPKGTETTADLVDNAVETLKHFNRWWESDGYDDPLDRVVPTYWGHQTLHVALEREVWHTAQHTRQVETLLAAANVGVTTGLSARVLDGLPMPERVFA
jgi:glutaredoxin